MYADKISMFLSNLSLFYTHKNLVTVSVMLITVLVYIDIILQCEVISEHLVITLMLGLFNRVADVSSRINMPQLINNKVSGN